MTAGAKKMAAPPGPAWGLPAAFLALLGLVVAMAAFGDGGAGFVDPQAILLVIGGTTAVIAISFPWPDTRDALEETVALVRRPAASSGEAVQAALTLANSVRRQGFKALDTHRQLFARFPELGRASELIEDGLQAKEIEDLMLGEAAEALEARRRAAAVFRRAAEVAPAIGLIGTLLGLIRMLGHMAEPSELGGAMAMALLTTFYGAVLAHMVLAPLAVRLERRGEELARLATVFSLTAQSMSRQENPRQLETLINAALPPHARASRIA